MRVCSDINWPFINRHFSLSIVAYCRKRDEGVPLVRNLGSHLEPIETVMTARELKENMEFWADLHLKAEKRASIKFCYMMYLSYLSDWARALK